jgi:hypothetical protein
VNRYRLRHIAVLGKAYREIASGPDGHGARGGAGSPERCSRIHAGRVRFDPEYRSRWLCLKCLKAAAGRESKAAHHQGKSPIKLHVRNPPIASREDERQSPTRSATRLRRAVRGELVMKGAQLWGAAPGSSAAGKLGTTAPSGTRTEVFILLDSQPAIWLAGHRSWRPRSAARGRGGNGAGSPGKRAGGSAGGPEANRHGTRRRRLAACDSARITPCDSARITHRADQQTKSKP